MYLVHLVHIDGADYTSLHLQEFTFASGALFGDKLCHFIEVVDDDILEGSEFFTVTLSSFEPAFQAGGSMQATVTINPDPADSKFTLNSVAYHVMFTVHSR